jgi:hypothetical protein
MPVCWRSCCLFLTVLLAGCHLPSEKNPDWIKYEITAVGLSVGPSYTLTLFPDGYVVFEGLHQNKTLSTRANKISADKAAAIFSEIDRTDFWHWKGPYYDQRIDNDTVLLMPTDTPIESITASRRHQIHRVENLFFAPPELKAFAQSFVATADPAAWVDELNEWKHPAAPR